MSQGSARVFPFTPPPPRPSAFPVRGAPAAVRLLDLAGRERPLRSAIQAMSRIAHEFARAGRRSLPFLARRRARLLADTVSLSPDSAAANAQLGPSFEVLLKDEDAAGWASLWFNAPALGVLLEGTLGGREGTTVIALGAELTAAQRAVVARIARALAEELIAVVRNEVGIELHLASLSPRRRGDTLHSTALDGLRVECTIEGDGSGAAIGVVVAAEALESAAKRAEGDPESTADPEMAAAMHTVPVEVSAELGRIRLGLDKVLTLTVGQVLRLPTATDDPVTVRVAGVAKFQGVPVVSRGQLSVEIRGRHEE
ncbi:MAG TPA: FliM/FliN family flagellar motor switch protein [Polyangiaceae bacterium]|nr:FliM/FliN family flagellar motor switch protein [Polyangiaceae bacterium]